VPATRREFLSRAALTAAVAGLGPGVAALVARSQRRSRPYLELALGCADWIDRSTQRSAHGIAWPADPLRPTSVGFDTYNGMPGVVTFFAQLWQATGDARWRDRAASGGSFLIAESGARLDRLGDGLYTGLAGLAATYLTLAELGVGGQFTDAARAATSRLIERAKRTGDAAEWSATNDIIGGTAGIGLFLLAAATTLKDAAAADFAVLAGRRLLQTAHPAEGGLMWFPAESVTRNYPNFSHGTAGVAYFLATLYQRSRDRAFLDGALAGVRYLEAVSTRQNGARAIFHVTGGGEDRFYLSWCHGPVGTARLFARLLGITKEPRWRTWIDELTAWVVGSGAPEQPSPGFWNNISQCCGNAGIGQYCIDLARHLGTRALDGLRERVVTHTMARADDDAGGLRWVQAEHRVQPENLVAQTGFMQGAAGVGTFFLQLDALARGVAWRAPWPDTPWTDR
jgi:lantibiotic modifying enzyme